MQTIDNKIVSRIYDNGRGYSFSQNEFSDLGSTDAVRKSLSRSEHTEKIVDDYFEKLDPIFSIIADCENGLNVDDLLEGPVCHAGFKRLN